MTRREFLARAGLSAGASAVALGVAEVMARLFVPRDPLVRMEQFSDLVEQEHRFRPESVFEPDDELFWRLRPDVTLPEDALPLFGLISNDQGLRSDHHVGAKKSGVVRVLFVGDSCTFGYRVAHDRTFVAAAERRLAELAPHVGAECVNAGVPGYSLFQGWRFLETRAPRLEPDLVVLNFGWNSPASWDGIGDLEHDRRMRRARPISGLRWSRICRMLWQALHRPGRERGVSTRPRVLPYEFRDLLGRANEATRRAGAELLILVGAGRSSVERTLFRDYLSPYQEEQLRFGESLRLGYVNQIPVVQAMAESHAPAQIFFDGVHTTPAANAATGEALARKIAGWLRR